MDERALYERILTIAGSVFDAYSAVLFLPDRRVQDFVLAAAYSQGEHLKAQASLKATRGVIGWIVKHNKPLLLNNLESKKAKLGYYEHDEEDQVKAFMGCPLGKGEGALCLDSKRSYSFSDKDQKVLAMFAELIREARLSTRVAAATGSEIRYHAALRRILGLRKQFTRWPVFLEQLLLILAETSGMDHCFLVSRAPDGDAYSLEGSSRPLAEVGDESPEFDIHTGLLGWVFKNNSPVFAGEDHAKGVLSPLFGKEAAAPAMAAVCLPIHFQRSTRAVLCLAHESAMDIPDSLKEFCLMTAEYLSLFLETLFLKTQIPQSGQG